jgi:hypothetical protein
LVRSCEFLCREVIKFFVGVTAISIRVVAVDFALSRTMTLIERDSECLFMGDGPEFLVSGEPAKTSISTVPTAPSGTQAM